MYWKQARSLGTGRKIETFLPSIIPRVLCVTTFISGLALLFSGATPLLGRRLHWLEDVLPLPVFEVSHFLGSVTGIILLLLAQGLRRRIDSAYWLSLILITFGLVLALLKADMIAASFLILSFIFFLPYRRYFYRHGSLLHQPFTFGWVISLLLLVVITFWLGMFSYQHVEYTDSLWWQFSIEGEAPRFLRASVGIIVTLFTFSIARLFGTARIKRKYASSEALDKAANIIEEIDDVRGNFALSGDKEFLFSPSQKSFIMYQVEGTSWIALGEPIGDPLEFESLIWQFQEACDLYGNEPVFYNLNPQYIDLYLDCGLTVTKIGEEACVPLDHFSLQGSQQKGLRSTIRKTENAGCHFSIIPKSEIPMHLPRFKEISDGWLKKKRCGEKGFSVGFYNETYLQRYPAAIIKKNNQIVAFANIWASPHKNELSIDLLRFTDEAPHRTMEYLIIQLMLWGHQQGYRFFILGGAPLSGLENHMLAPAWYKFASFLFSHSERVFNFQGLRRFKEKFNPQWQPRYIASHGGIQLPHILTNVLILISGSWKKIFFK